jgi:hypothetical protein
MGKSQNPPNREAVGNRIAVVQLAQAFPLEDPRRFALGIHSPHNLGRTLPPRRDQVAGFVPPQSQTKDDLGQ